MICNRKFSDEFTIDRGIKTPVFEEVIWDKAQKHIAKQVNAIKEI